MTSRRARFTPGKETRYPWKGGWVGPRAGVDWCGKPRTTGIRFPDCPARSESLHRLLVLNNNNNNNNNKVCKHHVSTTTAISTLSSHDQISYRRRNNQRAQITGRSLLTDDKIKTISYPLTLHPYEDEREEPGNLIRHTHLP